MSRITFLGLGAMGSRMVTHLMNSDHQITVWNRSAEAAREFAAKGARIATSPADAAREADVVFSMVRDDHASHDVWLDEKNGALQTMPKGAVAIECSTLTPAWVNLLARKCQAAGMAFADAPVAGSRPQAEAANLIFLVGTEPQTLATIQPLLELMGSDIHHCGPTGSGATVKLAINALFGIQIAAVAELHALIGKTGLDVQQAHEIISATPVCSPAAKLAGNAMIAAKYDPAFPITLAEKDFGYAEETALTTGTSLPLTNTTRKVLQQAIDAGFGESNITGVARLYE